jgi:hypothetical protein
MTLELEQKREVLAKINLNNRKEEERIKLIVLEITDQKISTIIGGGTIIRFFIVYSLFTGRLQDSSKTKSVFFLKIFLFTLLIFTIQSFAGILLEILIDEI